VFYFDGELPLSQMQGRIRAFGVNAEQPENFRLLNPELLPAKKWAPFTDRKAWKQATHALEKFRADVVIFDSLSTLFRFNTNDQDQWLIVNPMLLELRFAGYCVLILNHTGKDSTKGPRGSSQQEDLLDVSVVLDKFPNWEPGDDLAAQWRYTKVRAGGRLPSFDVIVDRDPDSRPRWRINPDTEAKQEAREMLMAGKGIHTVARKTGLSEWTVKKLKEEIRGKGLQKLNQRS
jgi:putative AlgH/UPF0301 family transcriptional regulator